MKYTGKLISVDFELNTMEFEIKEDVIAKAGTYMILSKEEYKALVEST